MVSISVGRAAAMTQLQYIQYLVQVTGESHKFNASANANDYVQWANSLGMNPDGGWKPAEVLTDKELVETVAQLLNINTKKSLTAVKNELRRMGVEVPEAGAIDRDQLMATLNAPGLLPRIPPVFDNMSPIKGLPPGLAKQGKIPPGWTKKDGTVKIPPGLAKKGLVLP